MDVIVNVFFRGVKLNPKLNNAINSLFLFNFKKLNNIPKIIIKGSIIERRLGIKNIDKYTISNISTCKKFVTVNNLVICNNQEIVKNMKKINANDLNISVSIYLLILLNIKFLIILQFYI